MTRIALNRFETRVRNRVQEFKTLENPTNALIGGASIASERD
jgi:hypothetical protein